MRPRTLTFCIALMIAAVAVITLELSGVSTGWRLRFRGDVARETMWLAQYGQFTCVVCIALTIWLIDPAKRRFIPLLIIAVLVAAGTATVVKLASGRVRPNHEHSGQFNGPFAEHKSANRSFPSGHTTSAFALSAVLAGLYPRGRMLFWTLATACGLLRWVQDAHWLSDVLAGAALGLFVAHICALLLKTDWAARSSNPWLRAASIHPQGLHS